jgi:hypothetical protein
MRLPLLFTGHPRCTAFGRHLFADGWRLRLHLGSTLVRAEQKLGPRNLVSLARKGFGESSDKSGAPHSKSFSSFVFFLYWIVSLSPYLLVTQKAQ